MAAAFPLWIATAIHRVPELLYMFESERQSRKQKSLLAWLPDTPNVSNASGMKLCVGSRWEYLADFPCFDSTLQERVRCTFLHGLMVEVCQLQMVVALLLL